MLKALLINLGVFSGLFLLHIVFAANGMDMAFTAVALLISLQTIGFGPLTVALTGTKGDRRQTSCDAVLGWRSRWRLAWLGPMATWLGQCPKRLASWVHRWPFISPLTDIGLKDPNFSNGVSWVG